jgi:hypothetical protein
MYHYYLLDWIDKGDGATPILVISSYCVLEFVRCVRVLTNGPAPGITIIVIIHLIIMVIVISVD